MREPPATPGCPRCGAALPAAAPGGHCPQCLIRTSLLGASRATEGKPDAALVHFRAFGNYELLDEIARGGMGVVYRARQRSLDRLVAVKMLLGGEFAGPDFVRRFRREAEAVARLRHPNIVAVYEFGVHEGNHFLAMEFIEGRSLADWVREQPLPARRAGAYLRTIALAVAFAHEQGILHRDLKPSNVLIDAATDQPRITDFGLAKRFSGVRSSGRASDLPPPEEDGNPPGSGHGPGPGSTEALTLPGHALGSPAYMAPEQVAGRDAASPASDLYALGALFYHLVTGRPPFQSDSIAETLRQVHADDPVPPPPPQSEHPAGPGDPLPEVPGEGSRTPVRLRPGTGGGTRSLAPRLPHPRPPGRPRLARRALLPKTTRRRDPRRRGPGTARDRRRRIDRRRLAHRRRPPRRTAGTSTFGSREPSTATDGPPPRIAACGGCLSSPGSRARNGPPRRPPATRSPPAGRREPARVGTRPRPVVASFRAPHPVPGGSPARGIPARRTPGARRHPGRHGVPRGSGERPVAPHPRSRRKGPLRALQCRRPARGHRFGRRHRPDLGLGRRHPGSALAAAWKPGAVGGVQPRGHRGHHRRGRWHSPDLGGAGGSVEAGPGPP
jgi:serine/threonine protein kinase